MNAVVLRTRDGRLKSVRLNGRSRDHDSDESMLFDVEDAYRNRDGRQRWNDLRLERISAADSPGLREKVKPPIQGS
jgi:hypothetical protein